MHDELPSLEREHNFHAGNPHGERNTWLVVAITAAMMVVEVICGRWFGSMALLADGWHMATHVAALGITAAAYWFARKHADDARYAFGTWKIEVLGGYTSAVVLAIVALWIGYESVERLVSPAAIDYDDALAVTALGLVVNLGCAFILQRGGHDHAHAHGHAAQGHDMNLRAAYMHVLADAMTSILAIGALSAGKFLQWPMLDPVTGLVGAAVIGIWAVGLLRDTSGVLLDREMDHPVVREIRDTLEADGGARVTDLHVWRVGRNHYACVVDIVSKRPKTAHEYRKLLTAHEEIVHATIEVRQAEEMMK